VFLRASKVSEVARTDEMIAAKLWSNIKLKAKPLMQPMITATTEFAIYLLSELSKIDMAYAAEAVYAIRIEYAAPSEP
jgi:hypothetical protein